MLEKKKYYNMDCIIYLKILNLHAKQNPYILVYHKLMLIYNIEVAIFGMLRLLIFLLSVL